MHAVSEFFLSCFDFPEMVNGSQSFRWSGIASLREDELSFPVDRYVLGLMKDRQYHMYDDETDDKSGNQP